jgi:hypothetical protein
MPLWECSFLHSMGKVGMGADTVGIDEPFENRARSV